MAVLLTLDAGQRVLTADAPYEGARGRALGEALPEVAEGLRAGRVSSLPFGDGCRLLILETLPSDQHFRDLLDDLDGIVWEADATRLTFTFVSRQAEELCGWHDFHARLALEDRTRYLAELEGGRPEIEYRGARRDGREVWLRDLVVREDGRLRGFTFDITERKRVERRMSLAHAVTRMLVDASSIAGLLEALASGSGWRWSAIWMKESDGNLRCVETWQERGFESASLDAVCRAGVQPPLEVRQWIPDVRILGSRGALAWELGLHQALLIPIQIGAEPVGLLELFAPAMTSPDVETLELWHSTAAQIGQVLHHRRAGAERDAFFRQSLDLLAILGWDGTLRDCNAAWQHRLGYPREELLCMSMLDLVHPDDLGSLLSALEALQNGGAQAALELRLHTRQWTWLSFAWNAVASEERRSIYAVAHDITMSQQTAAALQAARQAAEQATRAKSEFLANVSHEIRTPMNAIIGMTDVVLDGRLAPQERDIVGMVRTSAESLLALLNDILDLSKMEAGRLQLAAAPFSLRDTVDQCLKGLAGRAQSKGIEVLQDVDESVPDLLMGDAVRIAQVLRNLIGNAVKFTERGEIGVTVRGQCITVWDTGIGIPRTQQTSIFNAFSQADASAARRFGGAGLGLAIAARLAAMMGARLRVESQPGQGSQFHFELHLPVTSSEPTSPPLLGSRSVLVVDDNGAARRLTVRTLERAGVRAGEAGSADEALSMLAACPVDVVLADADMPDRDGFSLAAALQGHPELAGRVVLMLPLSLQRSGLSRCRPLGARALLKPFRDVELWDVVE
ncbi:MAG: ATP-binding protein [Candidatus Xenobia bacterium]